MQHILYRIAVWAILAAGCNTLHAQAVTVVGYGTKGEKGPKGEKGSKGEKGEKGEKDDETVMLSKEVTTETVCAANATIFIENSYRDIHIKTSPDSKVRLVTTAFYTKDSKLTDAEWFEKLNIQLKGSGSMIIIKSGSVNINSTNNLGFNAINGNVFGLSGSSISGTVNLARVKGFGSISTDNKTLAVLDSEGSFKAVKSDTKRDITIYIPSGAKIDVESKYSDVDINSNIGEIKARITNGSLLMADAAKAIVISQYGNVNAGNIGEAQLEVTNGRLRTKDIGRLDIDTKYSDIELGSCNEITMRSVNDQYEIDQVKDLHGRKDYGNLRITSLAKSFDLEGSNADIKIRSIEASVTDIKIDNKYADLRLPVNNLKNYAVNFDGQFSSVYAPFEKVNTDTGSVAAKTVDSVMIWSEEPIAITGNSKKTKSKKTTASGASVTYYEMSTQFPTSTLYGSGGNFGEGKDSKFTAAVGDTKGVHTNFKLKCINCTVDFK